MAANNMRADEMTANNMAADSMAANSTAENQAEGGRRKKAVFWTAKDSGIDGILVTVGLCIIALLLCVVMKESLTDFIQTIVGAMTARAQEILGGSGAVPGI